MTREQIKQIIRVCGLGFDYWDIPPVWRKDISQDDWEFSEEAEREKRSYKKLITDEGIGDRVFE